MREAHKEAGEYVLSSNRIMDEVTVGKEQSEAGLVGRASYGAAEKAKIFMALKISEGSESLDQARKTITEIEMHSGDRRLNFSLEYDNLRI